jgi:prepilin-type N-terminal cleavage/methylation domain-containing protein
MNRRGFTLVEVVVALVLLAFGMLAVQSAVLQLVRRVGEDSRASLAAQLIDDRLELIRADPRFDLLQSRYQGTETDPSGNTGLTRQTAVLHVRDSTARGITEYQRVTVTVSGSGLLAPVSRTVSVGAP